MGMAAPSYDRETILRAIEAWPLAALIELTQSILRRATDQVALAERGERRLPQPQRPGWREMAGLAARPGQEPPTDEQVEQWLDERREERAGDA